MDISINVRSANAQPSGRNSRDVIDKYTMCNIHILARWSTDRMFGRARMTT